MNRLGGPELGQAAPGEQTGAGTESGAASDSSGEAIVARGFCAK